MNHQRALFELSTMDVESADLMTVVSRMESRARQAKRIRTGSAIGVSFSGSVLLLTGLWTTLRPTAALAFSKSLAMSQNHHNSKREHYVFTASGTRQLYFVEYFSSPNYRWDTYSSPFGKDNHLWSVLISSSGETTGVVIGDNGKFANNVGGSIDADWMKARSQTDDFEFLRKSLKVTSVVGPTGENWRGRPMFKYELKLPTWRVTAYVDPSSNLIRFMDVFLDAKSHPQSYGRNFLHQQTEITYPQRFPEETFDREKLKSILKSGGMVEQVPTR